MTHREESSGGALTKVKARILLISFYQRQLESLSQGLTLHGYETSWISDPIAALERVYGMQGPPPDALVININGMQRTCMEVMKIIRGFRPGLPIIASIDGGTFPGMEDLEAIGVPVVCNPPDFARLDRDIQALLSLAETVRKGGLLS